MTTAQGAICRSMDLDVRIALSSRISLWQASRF